jgi:murein DD-endopeptidase MepM/ murein hydrolase activator NlpD
LKRLIFIFAAASLVLLVVFHSPRLDPAFSADFPAAGDWQQFERRVRDDQISYEEGLREIDRWWKWLQHAYPAREFDQRVFFPLRGYGLKHVGGKRGEGFRPSRYEFVGPKRRIGHPAQDIFVYDGNQDGLEDKTGAPIEVLSIAEGIVMSTFSEWSSLPEEPGNGKRGGNYVWIYHPALNVFAYYAHLQEVKVDVGRRVAGGQGIATLGRTGTNAYAERSPTHLHLMLLRAEGMRPVDPFPFLKGSHESR